MRPVEARQSSQPTQVGQYQILCELGHGAMAMIYLGKARVNGREQLFAIKTAHDHLSHHPSFVDMFLGEAQIAKRIRHPNVVAVHEVDADAGRHFIVMDYVSGESLASTLRQTWTRARPFPLATSLHIVAQASDGLHAAHELVNENKEPLLVVHRDVAPQNIMVGYDGVVRMMDFGIAKALDRVSRSRPGAIKGTIAYMSPEQIRCEELDRRADVFALGVVLWEAVVGKRLFKADSEVNTAARVLRMNIPRPSAIRRELPTAVDEIVMTALDRDRTKRFPSARAFGDALRVLIAQSVVDRAAVSEFMKVSFGPMWTDRVEMEREALVALPGAWLDAPVREGTTNLNALTQDIGT